MAAAHRELDAADLHGAATGLDAQLVEATVVVVGSTEIVFSDYGVTVPSAPIVVSVADRGTLELQLLLVKR